MIRVGDLVFAHGTVLFARGWHAQLWFTSDQALPTSVSLVSEDNQMWSGKVTQSKLFSGQRWAALSAAPELDVPLPPKAYRQTNLRAVLTHTLSQAGLELDPTSDETALRARVSVHVRMDTGAGPALDALASQYNFMWDVSPQRAIRVNPPALPITGLVATEDSDGAIRGDAPGFIARPGMTYNGTRVRRCVYQTDKSSMRVEMWA